MVVHLRSRSSMFALIASIWSDSSEASCWMIVYSLAGVISAPTCWMFRVAMVSLILQYSHPSRLAPAQNPGAVLLYLWRLSAMIALFLSI